MNQEPPMICSNCGAVMNHHADKIDYSVEEPEDDPVFGGAVQEVHTCPNCARIQTRRA